MKLIIDEWIVREVIDTLYMANATLLGITGLDSPQEVAKKSANETAITRRISKAIDIIQQSEQPKLPPNLDEAAEEIMPISYGALEIDIYGGSEPVYSREQMVEMFKAGVELIAGQFQKIEVDGLVGWFESTAGKEYCFGFKSKEAFEVPEGFYIKKK